MQPFRDELFGDQQRRKIIAESIEKVLLIRAEVTRVTCIVQNLQRKLAVAARARISTDPERAPVASALLIW